MADLIFSCITQPPSGDPRGYRIWTDGQADTYQVSAPVRTDEGQIELRPVKPDFYPVARLSAAQVGAIISQMDASGLRDLAARSGHEFTASHTRETITWEVPTALGTRTLTIAPWPPEQGSEAEVLLDLVLRVGAIILAAQAGSVEIPA